MFTKVRVLMVILKFESIFSLNSSCCKTGRKLNHCKK